MYINFAKLKRVLSSPTCKINKGNESSACLCEFTAMLANYIEHNHGLTEEELAMIIMSTQNWINRREYTKCRVPVNVGDIFFADLGNNYKPEYSYPHPVVILEKIGILVLVVPVSTSPDNIKKAYHPIDNPTGSKYLRKVYGNDSGSKSDGFEKTSALLLSNIRTISQGRLLEKKGQLKNINDKNSLFAEIKNTAFKLCFPKQYIEKVKLQQDYEELLEKYNKLSREFNDLKNTIENNGY